MEKREYNFIDIIALDFLEGYNLLVTFADEPEKPRVFPMMESIQTLPGYKALLNIGFFRQGKFDSDTVYWNKNIDICPERLYEDSIPYEEWLAQQKK